MHYVQSVELIDFTAVFEGIIWRKNLHVWFCPLRSQSYGHWEGRCLLIGCSSVASGVLMLHCWKATLCSRLSLLSKENKKTEASNPLFPKLIINTLPKYFSMQFCCFSIILLCTSHTGNKNLRYFFFFQPFKNLKGCSLLLMSLMLLLLISATKQ